MQSGADPESWIRAQCLNAVPRDFRKRFAREALAEDAVVEAFEELDHLRAEVAVLKASGDQSLREVLEARPLVVRHSCAFLREGPPEGLNQYRCLGTCSSPERAALGRACQYNSSVASHCEYFHPRGGKGPR